MNRLAFRPRSLLPMTAGIGLFLIGMIFQAICFPPPAFAADNAKRQTVRMRVAGMTCAACARGLEASFRKMAGVENVDIDYKAGQAVITFDPSKHTTDSLSKFIAECGYRVKEVKVV